jgi:hypothetical protein
VVKVEMKDAAEDEAAFEISVGFRSPVTDVTTFEI